MKWCFLDPPVFTAGDSVSIEHADEVLSSMRRGESEIALE